MAEVFVERKIQILMAQLGISEFMNNRERTPIVDVRSPGEFEKGHIPGAVNIPLLNDEERTEIGTLYKQFGKQRAMARGFELLAPKTEELFERFKEHSSNSKVKVYCWRGGLRSESVSWFLERSGFDVNYLKGGYQAYRRKLLDIYSKELDLRVIGGYTGSGKTEALKVLAEKGEQVIDLEELAKHKGSVFGERFNDSQPESEHFNNLLAEKINSLDPSQPIWVEDESLSIGKVYLAHDLYHKMQESKWVFIDIPQLARAEYLVKTYDDVTQAEVEIALSKIEKRMGGQNVKAAREAMQVDERMKVVSLLLNYYDKAYQHSLKKKNQAPYKSISHDRVDSVSLAEKILQ